MYEAQKNSVRNLEGLYSTVVGLALSLAILRVIDTHRAPIPVSSTALPCFFAFLATVIPFYHGALRHLDITYVEKAGRDVAPGGLLFDFGFLFLEGCLLLALAALLRTPQFYGWFWLALLVVDLVWGFLAHIAFSARDVQPRAEVRWAIINTVCATLLAILLLTRVPYPPTTAPAEPRVPLLLLVLSLARTIADYGGCWGYYYPSPHPATE